MKRIICLILVLILGAVSLCACTSNVETINLTGSSALKPLVDIAKDKFLALEGNENVIINSDAGGSGTGLADVASGVSHIGNSDLFAEEKLTPAQCADLVDNKVCIVSMAIVVSAEVPVTTISTADIQGIYSGTITNWNQVEGCTYDKAILVCTRPTSSGTRATFDKYVLDGVAATVSGEESDNSGEIATKLAENDNAIAYLALSYLVDNDNIKTVQLNGVAPTYANCYNGTYAAWAYEHMYTKGEATGAVKAFIQYIMSAEFAPVIETAGYGVSSKLTDTALATHE